MKAFRMTQILMAVFFSAAMLFGSVASADSTDARTDLAALWGKMTAQHDLAFKATMTSTDHKGRVTDMVMKVQWPNRFHMKTKESEIIILPNGTWMNAGGQWMKLPVDMQKMIAQFSPEMVDKTIESSSDVRFIGLDQIDGKPVKVYLYNYDTKVMGISSTGQSKVYLSVVSGFPLRVENDGKAMGKASKSVIDYDYDADIHISAPN